MVKERNIILVYVFWLITFGIYALYWWISTKREFNNEFGAQVPTAWLIIIPVANIYWLFKYAEAFANNIKKDNNVTLWAILFILVGFVTPGFVQSELNKSVGGVSKPTTKPAAKPVAKQSKVMAT